MSKILIAAAATFLLGTTAANAIGTQLFASLFGGNETAAADTNGHGAASFIIVGSTTLCYGYSVAAIDKPVAAHIHKAAAGLNGPVVIGLAAPTSGTGSVSGCVRNVPSAVLSDIRLNPSNYYINVHTGAFPGGAVRGQLY